jgi:uncharacterized membrane protein
LISPRVTGEKSAISPSVTAKGGYSKGGYSKGGYSKGGYSLCATTISIREKIFFINQSTSNKNKI